MEKLHMLFRAGATVFGRSAGMAIKLRALVLITTAVLFIVPSMVMGQGIPGVQYGPGPLQPSMYPPSGGQMPCLPGPGTSCGPMAACPPFMMSECGPKNYMEPTLYFGYAYNEKGVGFKLEASDGVNVGAVERFRQDFDVKGLWLELQTPITISECLGLSLGGSHMFPLATNSTESYVAVGPTASNRKWKTDVQWWDVEAVATYKLGCSMTVLGGFRWDSYMSNFKDPYDATFATSTPQDESDVTFSGYIPFVGLQLVQEVSCYSIVRATVIGTPIFWGDYIYKETIGGAGARLHTNGGIGDGRFIEAMGEAAIKLSNVHIGAFAKYSALRGTDKTSLDLDAAATGRETGSFKFSFDRSHWIFGARIGLTFASPF
jgi:hypothetical protein